MIKVTIERTGKGIKQALANVRKNLEHTAERAVKAVAQQVFERSQQLVPLDTTLLRDTAGLHVLGGGFYTIAWVGYGPNVDLQGYSPHEGRWVNRNPSDYAIFVHEGYPTSHFEHGEMEYLLKASNETARPMLEAVLQVVWITALRYS